MFDVAKKTVWKLGPDRSRHRCPCRCEGLGKDPDPARDVEAWTTAVRPPSRRKAAAASRLIARVGPPISHWGMSRPLAPLSPRQRGFPFLRGVGAAPKPIKQG